MKGWLPRRIRFVKSASEQGADGRRVSVELLRPDERRYVGQAEGPDTDSDLDLTRAGAEAAAQAVVSAAGVDGTEVKVEALERVNMFGRDIVIVSVVATYRGQSFSLFGISPAHDDPATTGALAVLSATNRVLELS
jgi:hypothetical protein